MPYRIWFGSARTPVEFQSMRRYWVARQRETLHDALWDAMMIEGSGSEQAWEIQGDDGVRIGRPKLLEMIRQRRDELIAQPPQSESETSAHRFDTTVAQAAPAPANGATNGHGAGFDAPALRSWRDANGLSLADAAEMLGLDALTLRDMEAGQEAHSPLWGPVGRIVALLTAQNA